MTYAETIQKAINRFSRDITKKQTEKGITQKQLATEIGCRDGGSALSRLRLYGKCSQQLVLVLCEYFKLNRKAYFTDEQFAELGTSKKIKSEVVDAPIEPIEIDFLTPSYEEYKPEETINESDELVTKGMLKDYIRDLLISFLEGIV